MFTYIYEKCSNLVAGLRIYQMMSIIWICQYSITQKYVARSLKSAYGKDYDQILGSVHVQWIITPLKYRPVQHGDGRRLIWHFDVDSMQFRYSVNYYIVFLMYFETCHGVQNCVLEWFNLTLNKIISIGLCK